MCLSNSRCASRFVGKAQRRHESPHLNGAWGSTIQAQRRSTSSLSALRVYEASPGKQATEIRTTGGPKIHWTRRTIAEWFDERLIEAQPTLRSCDL
jgi:hypothetical protein